MKRSISTLSLAIFIASIFSLVAPATTTAATTPTLGSTEGYAILSSTYTNTGVATITGSVGFTTPPAVVPAGIHINYGSGAQYAVAGTDQGVILSSLNTELCTFTFPAGAIDLSTDVTHGIIGVYSPGVYCSTGAMDIGGPLTLNGRGTYIFRPAGALTSTANAVVALIDTSACDLFWTPTEATTIAANTIFAGTVIDDAGVTVGANSIWVGRALSFGGTVTTDTLILSVPTCVTHTPVDPVIVTPVTPFPPAVVSQEAVLIAALPTAALSVAALATPAFPRAGLPPTEHNSLWSLVVSGIISLTLITSLSVYIVLDQKRRRA